MALTLGILGLCVAPLLVLAFGRGRKWDAFFDGYVLVTMVGLIGWEMLPHSIEKGGFLAAVVIGLGMLFPTWLERRTHGGHGQVAWLAFIALLFHAVLDGAALGFADAGAHFHAGHSHGHGHSHNLKWAVILHRLPVGLMVFTLVEQLRGRMAAVAALGALAVATVVGFTGGGVVSGAMSSTGAVVFEAFVIGALLHVVFHDHASHHHDHEQGDCCSNQTCSSGYEDHPHGHGHDHDQGHADERSEDERGGDGHHQYHHHDHDHGSPNAAVEGIGALLGFATLGFFAYSEGVSESGRILVHLFLESAPALVFAYVAAGLLSALAIMQGLTWMGRGSRVSQAARGMAFGLPLPVCSCGVLPLYESLARKGAPATAGLAFLIATPELGVDAVLLSIPLLGVEMTAIRVAAAAIVAIVAAVVVGRMMPDRVASAEVATSDQPLSARLKDGLRYGLGELVDHTLPWIILGIGIAALIEPLLTPTALSNIPAVAQVPLFAVLGIPMYICASGATPFAAVLVLAGVSPGAALAFLLTGPATNVTTFGVMSQLHGRRIAAAFGITVTLAAIASGWSVDLVVGDLSVALDPDAEASVPIYQIVAAVGLVLLFLSSLFRQGPRGMLHQVFKPHE